MSAGSFTGILHVAEKGAKARFLVSELGRFAQADSIVANAFAPQGLNRFSYVLDNPVNYVDPTGHIAENSDDEREKLARQLSLAGIDSADMTLWQMRLKLRELKHSGTDFEKIAGRQSKLRKLVRSLNCGNKGSFAGKYCVTSDPSDPGHAGAYDILAAYGDPVYAVANGDVYYDYREDYGYYAMLKVAIGSNIIWFIYAHLMEKSLDLQASGTFVTAGTQIGYVGNSGKVYSSRCSGQKQLCTDEDKRNMPGVGTHLHWEARTANGVIADELTGRAYVGDPTTKLSPVVAYQQIIDYYQSELGLDVTTIRWLTSGPLWTHANSHDR